MTIIDLGNIRINWCGPYDSTASYEPDDAVSYQGSSFIAKQKSAGITPVVADHWDLLAAGTDQLTTEGDLLIHNGQKPVRLPRGENTQILQMVDGQPSWQTQALDPSRRVWKLAKVNSLGGWHVRVYLMADGTVKACGYGSNHSNGDASGSNLHLPSRVVTTNPDVRFIDVFSGGLAHYGLTAEGHVFSWGLNNYGQLGHGETISRAVAKRIEYFTNNKIKIAKVIPCRSNY